MQGRVARSAVASVDAVERFVFFDGVADTFGTSGEPRELMEHFGLTAAHIVEAAMELLG